MYLYVYEENYISTMGNKIEKSSISFIMRRKNMKLSK